MKNLILTSIALLFITSIMAQSTLTISIADLDSNNGEVYIALYDSQQNYLRKEIKGAKIKINEHVATVVFEDIPYGEYAISSFHDENGNGKMDTMLFGIPTEDYGFSNNALAMFGPAKWAEAKFKIEKDMVTHVINY